MNQPAGPTDRSKQSFTKVIGVGLNKTGTTSLGLCFQEWGLDHISGSSPAFDLWKTGDIEGVLDMAADFQTYEDWPWPLLFKEFDERFPGSKFVLTTRRDPETWFRSLSGHADRTGPTEYRKLIYGYDMPRDYREEHIAVYLNHNQSVRDYFSQRPADLLEVCWENGDGWNELSQFLGLTNPGTEFPHAMRSPTFSSRAKNWIKTRVTSSR